MMHKWTVAITITPAADSREPIRAKVYYFKAIEPWTAINRAVREARIEAKQWPFYIMARERLTITAIRQ